MPITPTLPAGTRDFSPTDMVKRNHIFHTIRTIFERYGYQPIETPAMENLSTLEGKYGEEGDKLLFRILNSGPILEKIKRESAQLRLSDIAEKGLRYDLTVPFARYVVQHLHTITFPFKRYQIQPVWRADRPQKGRYREFYQCDADVIGSSSLLNEVEMFLIIRDVFRALRVPFVILYNHRKILSGLKEVLQLDDKDTMEIILAIDKYEKYQDRIFTELHQKGFPPTILQRLQEFLSLALDIEKDAQKQELLQQFFSQSPIAMEGFSEITKLQDLLSHAITDPTAEGGEYLRYSPYLARGMNYYTGTIFEVKAVGVTIGSICGGGRYDNLTGIFGKEGMSGIGLSFGIDRIFDVMDELNIFQELSLNSAVTKVLLAHIGNHEPRYAFRIASQLRAAGINTEIYPDMSRKISKQLEYAHKKQIPFVVIIGSQEIETGILTLRNMRTGEQTQLNITQIIEQLSSC